MAPSAESPVRPTTPRLPKSPSSPATCELDRLLHDLSIEFGIPELAPPIHSWAPAQARKTDGALCSQLIRYLYFNDYDGLQTCLDCFRSPSVPEKSASKLRFLLKVQRGQTSRTSRSSERASRRHTSGPLTSGTKSVETSFDSVFSNQRQSADTSFTTNSDPELGSM